MDHKKILDEAIAAEKNNRFQEGIEILRKGLRQFPGHPDLVFELARLHERMKLWPQAQNQPPVWQVAPPAGMIFPVASQPAPVFEATIFAPKLPTGFTPTGLLPLTSYQCATDDITTTSAPSDPSCVPVAFEG